MEIKPIRTEKDYRTTLSRIEELMDATPNSQEEDELDVLASLVEIYESKHYPIPDAHPLEAIKFVMEQNNMLAKDLMPYLGGSGRVSEILGAHRPLTINMIRKLIMFNKERKNYEKVFCLIVWYEFDFLGWLSKKRSACRT